MSLAHVCLCLSNDYFTTSPVSLLFTTGMNCFLRVVLWKCMRLETARCTVNRQPEVCPKLDNGHAKIVNSSSFCVWVPLLLSMDLNCYGCHETSITSFSFFQARRLFAPNEASVSIGGCSHRRSELKLVKVESATVPAVPKDSCVACWWRSRGWKPGTTHHSTSPEVAPKKTRSHGLKSVVICSPANQGLWDLQMCWWQCPLWANAGGKNEAQHMCDLMWEPKKRDGANRLGVVAQRGGQAKACQSISSGKGSKLNMHLFGELILDWFLIELSIILFFSASSGSA